MGAGRLRFSTQCRTNLERLFPNPTSSAIASQRSRSDEVSRRRNTLLLFSLFSFIRFFFVILMREKILGCPEGFSLWQAGGVTNIKRSKKCTYPAFARSSQGLITIEKINQHYNPHEYL
jgi:hypothetical protein